MAILISIIILALAIFIAFKLSSSKSKKKKYIVWCLTTMLAIAPFLSWLVSIMYGINKGDGVWY